MDQSPLVHQRMEQCDCLPVFASCDTLDMYSSFSFALLFISANIPKVLFSG
jgi:hypothetical protein